jgi:hypothetical protein
MENEIINIDMTEDIVDTNTINQEEIERDLLFRQSKLLYPDVEDWVLNMAIEAYQNELKQEKDMNENFNTKIYF